MNMSHRVTSYCSGCVFKTDCRRVGRQGWFTKSYLPRLSGCPEIWIKVSQYASRGLVELVINLICVGACERFVCATTI